jgi:hypothetical protein
LDAGHPRQIPPSRRREILQYSSSPLKEDIDNQSETGSDVDQDMMDIENPPDTHASDLQSSEQPPETHPFDLDPPKIGPKYLPSLDF